ncbi:heterokaryon incompatibility protein-domain-containing protein [Phaeosphaeria sp. MPI-PUGE-AT-0046c]|nr:heterokaryon incompatibility protein-domain-containing protein [Phaeosphaeria sp. MPI-PUGE-AT-0046c]
MALPDYHYKPLTSKTSFRLFQISKSQPGPSTGNQIQIHLFEADFNDAPAFEAVSYAWGHDTVSKATILCNDHVLSVTPNVEAVLEMLAQQESNCAYWVDSICIDQSSVPERNIQVPRMRSIYSEAVMVWVWLGKGTQETTTAMSFLVEVAEILRELRLSTEYGVSPSVAELTGPHAQFRGTLFRAVFLSSFKNRRTHCINPLEKVRVARGFYDAVDTNFIVDLLNLDWFHRTWTVQELVLARTAVLACGSVRITYSDFLETLQKLQDHELAEASLTSRSNPASFYDDTQCYRTLTRFLRSSGHNLKVSAILRMVRPKSSSKPEDKVYGLYGVFNHLQIRQLPQVDYNRPVHTIFTQITIAAIEVENSLNVLYSTCLPQLVTGLPSWVPDWSNAAYHRPISLFGLYADRQSTLTPPYEIQENRLTVKGNIIDEIHEVAESTSIAMASFRRGYNARLDKHETENRRTGVLELVKTLQAWIRLSRKVQKYPTDTTPLKAFYRVILQNSAVPSNLDPNLLDDALDEWMQIITANSDQSSDTLQTLHDTVRQVPEYKATVVDYARVFEKGPNASSWPTELQIRLFLRLSSPRVAAAQHDIFLNTYHKTFLITRDGYMGTCPRWARAGDLVALIAGLKTAFIVRKEGKHYQLVGPAYVHGVMHGERWSTQDKQDITLV